MKEDKIQFLSADDLFRLILFDLDNRLNEGPLTLEEFPISLD
jgi:hypothetical protein